MRRLTTVLPVLVTVVFAASSQNVAVDAMNHSLEELKRATESGEKHSLAAAQCDVAEYVSEIVLTRRRKIADFGLSPREMEIVRLSVDGLSVAQIADRLFLSTRTVSNHRQTYIQRWEFARTLKCAALPVNRDCSKHV